MAERSSRDGERLYSLVPDDGTAIGNKALREKLRWGKEKYLEVRQELLDDGWIRLGHGRGGSVRRVQGEAQQMLANVPHDGTPISNADLRKRLGWREDQYWRVRNELIDQGVLVRGGRGGSVFRFIEDDWDEDEEKEIEEANYQRSGRITLQRESDLYDPIKHVLEKDWAKNEKLGESFLVEITAHNRNRTTSGKWKHPDLVVLSQRRFKLTGQRVFDIHTFEVKFHNAWDITAVYEALSHRRCATYSYVFLYQRRDSTRQNLLDECEKEAERLGVGLIVTDNPADHDAWTVRVTPRRYNADPADLESFVATQIPEERHRELQRWLK